MKHAVRAVITKDTDLLVMKRNKFGSEYYTLIGGGVEMGEGLETAIRREVLEEAGMQVGRIQLIFVEDAGDIYGMQYVFWCEYQGGDPVLQEESPEAKISAGGQNTYTPMWLPVEELETANFRSGSLKEALQVCFKQGFPSEPMRLEWRE